MDRKTEPHLCYSLQLGCLCFETDVPGRAILRRSSLSGCTVSAIGARVRRLRKSRGLSQIVLAELAGIHYNTLKRVESGDANPSIDVLLKLADTLDVTIVQLLGGK